MDEEVKREITFAHLHCNFLSAPIHVFESRFAALMPSFVATNGKLGFHILLVGTKFGIGSESKSTTSHSQKNSYTF